MDDALELAEKAAKNAKRAAVLALVAAAIAAAVLAIDNGIKRSILDEAAKCRGILAEFKAVADGAKAAQQDRVAASGDLDSGDGVVHAAGASAAAGDHADNGMGPARDRAGRFSARARGDG